MQFDKTTLPTGYSFTSQDQGSDDAADSDANPTDGKTIPTVLDSGESDKTWDAGVIAPAAQARLGDRVWEDKNGNGLQDAGEPGIAGVTVQLRDSNGNLANSTTTDANGNYSFTVDPGTYSVAVLAPAGYIPTTPSQGSDPGKDSNIDANGKTGTITLAEGENNPTIDAGLYKLAELGDRVWLDANKNGLQDAGETGVPGVKVSLLDSNGNIVGAPLTTDANGNYLFTGLKPGTYSVQFDKTTLPAGYSFTSQDQGNDDTADSDANPTDGKTIPTVLDSGESDKTWDAGVIKPAPIKGSIGDHVWVDTNGNGVQDTGELGKSGVTVNLYSCVNNKPGTLVTTTTTDANGNYLFDNLPEGDYVVRFVTPTGYSFSPANATTDDKDSDANPATSSATPPVTSSIPIPNGSFEANQYVDNGYGSTVSNWVSTGGSGAWNPAGASSIVSDGNNLAYVYAGTTLSQTLTDTLQKNTVYALSVDVGNATGAGDDYSAVIQLWAGNTKVGELTGAQIGSISDNGHKTATLAFDSSTLGDASALYGQALKVVLGSTATTWTDYDNVKLTKTTGSTQQLNDDAGYTDCLHLNPGENNTTVDAGLVEFKPCGKVTGDSNILEGTTKSYYVTLDQPVTQDTYVTVQIANGSAHQTDVNTVREYLTANALWNPNQYNNYGYQAGEWVQLYAPTQTQYNGIQETWLNDPVFSQSQRHNAPSNATGLYIGVDQLVNDFEIIGANGQVQSGSSFTVKVAAGSNTSETFQVLANKEVNVGKTTFGGFDTEGNENFSLQVAKVGNANTDPSCAPTTITIKDVATNVSPIVIDLNGDGIHTLSIDQGVQFDMLNAGEKVHTGWISGQDGFLAVDSNGNDLIDNRTELFGGNKGDGFAKLVGYDSNGDGWVNSDDARFAELRIWQDKNGNGVTDAGELQTLAQANVTSLKVDYTDDFSVDAQGNVFGERSNATLADGRSVDMSDVYFKIGVGDVSSTDVKLPSFAELLGNDTQLDQLLANVDVLEPQPLAAATGTGPVSVNTIQVADYSALPVLNHLDDYAQQLANVA